MGISYPSKHSRQLYVSIAAELSTIEKHSDPGYSSS
jgi:hypothetical protein